MRPKEYTIYYVEYTSPHETKHQKAHTLPLGEGYITTYETLVTEMPDDSYQIAIQDECINILKAIHDRDFYICPKYKFLETIPLSFNTLCEHIFDIYNPKKLNGKIRIRTGFYGEFNMEINADNLSILHSDGNFSHDKYKLGKAIDLYCNKFLFSKITYNNYSF